AAVQHLRVQYLRPTRRDSHADGDPACDQYSWPDSDAHGHDCAGPDNHEFGANHGGVRVDSDNSRHQLWLTAIGFWDRCVPLQQWHVIPTHANRNRLQHSIARERAHVGAEEWAWRGAGEQQWRRFEPCGGDRLGLSVIASEGGGCLSLE